MLSAFSFCFSCVWLDFRSDTRVSDVNTFDVINLFFLLFVHVVGLSLQHKRIAHLSAVSLKLCTQSSRASQTMQDYCRGAVRKRDAGTLSHSLSHVWIAVMRPATTVLFKGLRFLRIVFAGIGSSSETTSMPPEPLPDISRRRHGERSRSELL